MTRTAASCCSGMMSGSAYSILTMPMLQGSQPSGAMMALAQQHSGLQERTILGSLRYTCTCTWCAGRAPLSE
ncbi:MAG: hypothetical protein EOP33_09550 [Rickettsiaceae bacterium]|nr:MAG: hypothetical protein EOP33_09550 [Rickettsiaceae bacterium]